MASRDSEKYYWWKKNKNYYNDHRIKALHKKKNGYAYSVLLDKMKCESTPYKGVLKFSKTRTFTIEELSAVTDMPEKLIKDGLKAMVELELIKQEEDGTIIILDFEECTGYETGASKRMKEKREQMRNISGTNEEQMFLESRDKSIEIRDKILNSSSYKGYIALVPDREKEANDVVMMMMKAYQVTNILPSDQFLSDMFIYLLTTNESIGNVQGYLINSFKRERNTE